MMASDTRQDKRLERVTARGASSRPLHGRDIELGVLRDLVAQAAGRRGSALVVRGEAGIGKSALLAAAAARAIDQQMQVFSAAGAQSEAQIPFAGLHQLLRPVLRRAGRLPGQQQAALFAALGMAEQGAAPELLSIGLATLALIADAAARSPVLLIIEDAQWLDHASGAVLAFAARRLTAEPALMLIAVREGHQSQFDDCGLAEMRVEGLSQDAACALLDSCAPGLDLALRERLLEEAAGNPLALVELSTVVQPGDLPEGGPLPSRLPLTSRLERAFAAQASALPADARLLLLLAAADDAGVPGEVLQAATILGGRAVPLDAFMPAVSAGLVEIESTQLRFRHPVARSAIYQAESLPRRRAAHTALAKVLADHADRRVWHRAAAALGPDERVAAELDEAAVRARCRGASAAAVAALERAAALSAGPARRGGRLLRAAEMAFEFGRPALGSRLLGAAEALDLPAQERTWLSWLRETYAEAGWSGSAKVGSLVKMAERMRAGGRADLATESLLTVATRCWWGNPDQETRAAVTSAVSRLQLPDNAPARLAILAHADPVTCGALVVERVWGMTPDAADPAGMFLVGAAANAVWAYDISLGFLDTAVTGLRAQGRLGLLARALVAQAWAAAHCARGPLALSAAGEAARLARQTGQPREAASAQLAQATVAAERGDFTLAADLARQAEAVLVPMGAMPMLALAQFVRGHGAVARQRYPEGFEYLRRTLEPADPAYHPFIGAWGLSDLVEATVRTGDRRTARAYLRQLESLAAATSGSLLRAEAAYARPMVADDDKAEALYRRALDGDLANWPCYRGRMLLWYGRWLRRQRRAAEARAPLRAARDGFDALAFPELAQKARDELRASGESSRRCRSQAWDQLTPQELQIARLAADGLSNREIGQNLCISHRTVGYHLHRIFAKLQITSRGELHLVVPGSAGA